MTEFTAETYNGVPLSELFPQEKLGWRGYVHIEASRGRTQCLTQVLLLQICGVGGQAGAQANRIRDSEDEEVHPNPRYTAHIACIPKSS